MLFLVVDKDNGIIYHSESKQECKSWIESKQADAVRILTDTEYFKVSKETLKKMY